jgi:hypothetical protein
LRRGGTFEPPELETIEAAREIARRKRPETTDGELAAGDDRVELAGAALDDLHDVFASHCPCTALPP